MPKTSLLAKAASTVLAGAFVLALTSLASLAASDFEGVWKVKDTQGKPFRITLSEDGTAKANRSGEGLKGTWKEEDGSAVITWDTGWTTKIMKKGDKYKKAAYDKGQPLDGTPTNTSKAKKVTPKQED